MLDLDGAIDPGSVRYVERGLAEAERRGAALVVLRLDTPGGLVTSLREMTRAITSSPVPVVVYVAPSGARAASAGLFLVLAADVAAMAPGTNIGAAHPVALGGGTDDTSMDKATQDAAALARSLAAARGRPTEAAERAVLDSISYSAVEARERGLVDLVVGSEAELLAALEGRIIRRAGGEERLALGELRAVELPPTPGERFLMTVADPTVAYLLLVLGALGLVIELLTPGGMIAGISGAIALLLGLYGLSVLPVNVVGVVLLLLGIGLLVAEAFVTSFGLLAATGAAAFVLGSLLLFDDIRAPGMHGPGLGLVVPVAVVFAAATLFLATRAARVRRRPGLTGVEALLGAEGTVVQPLDPEGMVFVKGEHWTARADAPVGAGERVRVVGVAGNRLEVRPA